MQAKITALAACLFVAGLVLMFYAMFHEGSPGTTAVSLVVLAGAAAAWIWSACLGEKSGSSSQT